uniref:Gustatory receptor n=1 Tax=Timema genevievae TaxID=629358 RepID=A0A7R9K7Z4_TIMGE|nr:unnamed protein product [Timema genevievae]
MISHDSTFILVQSHFMFLVLMIREHLAHINKRLDYSVVKWEEVVVWSQHRAGIVGVARLVNAAYSVQISTFILVQSHFMFLVLMIRDHLAYINKRLDYSVVKWEEVVVWSQHRAGIVGVARLVNAAYSVQMLTAVAIVAASTTYLNILIQFQLSSKTTKEDGRKVSSKLVHCVNQMILSNNTSWYYPHQQMVAIQLIWLDSGVSHFMFLVLMIREHLAHINKRLDYSVVKWEEVVVWSQHRAGIVGVARLVNAAYSVQMLTAVTAFFIIITTSTFCMILSLGEDSLRNNLQYIPYGQLTLSMSYYGLLLFQYVYFCESAMSVANDTAVKVHAIIRRTRDAFLQNKIVAASTTYLIILIQFQLSSKTTKEDGRELDVIQCINYLNQTNSSYGLN